MAGSNLELALLLRLNDQMSRGLRAAMQNVSQESRTASRSVENIAAAANRVRPAGIERMNAALRTLHSTAKSTLSTLAKIGSTTAQVGSAVMAGGYVAKSAAERPMAYDKRLALLSNTANSDLDAAGRIAAKIQLDKGIRQAVNKDQGGGGGTPEQALDALNTLVGSGAFGNAKQAMSLLPMVQKNATGTGADSNDLAKIMIAAKQNMGIADRDMPAMLSKAIRAGQEGGFELSDMSKWLPQQMTLASANGMKGMAGFESLLAANQVSRIGAGTADEAGNNLVNLLAKINSQDTANDFKKQGIDLSGSLAAARSKGVNPLEAFVGLVEKIASKDKDYTNLRKKADSETGADQKATLSAMADILQQKSIGKAVQDRQALMELLMLIQQRGKYDDVKTKVGAEKGQEGETSYQVVASTLDSKAEQVGNKKAFAAIDTLNAIDAPLGKLLDKLNAEAEAHPILTTAIYSTVTAFGVLAAAAGAGGLMGLLTRGKGVGAGVGAAATAAATAAARPAISYAGEIPASVAAAAAARNAAGRSPGLLARAATGVGGLARGAAAAVGGVGLGATALVAGSGLAGYRTGSALYNHMGDDTRDKIGGVIAQALANFGNKEAQSALDSRFSLRQPLNENKLAGPRVEQTSRQQNAVAGAKPSGRDAEQPVIDAIANSLNQVLKNFVSQTIKVDVDVRNGNIVAAVNQANTQQARRN
jgi:hypothetical protein